MKEYTRPELEVVLFQAEAICTMGEASGDYIPPLEDD